MWYKLSESKIQRFHAGKFFNSEMFRAFTVVNRFNRYSFPGDQDYARYLKTGRSLCGYPHVFTSVPPYMDHARSFKNTASGVICLAYQPYRMPSEIEMEVNNWADKRGLIADIYDKRFSWYYPGGTCLVIIHLPGTSIFLK